MTTATQTANSKFFKFRVNDDFRKKIHQYAENQNLTASELIRNLLAEKIAS